MLMAEVLNHLFRESSLLAPDFPSFRRQESAFILLNLFVLAVLLLIHSVFSARFGVPTRALVLILGSGFLLNVAELIWVQKAKLLGPTGIVLTTWLTVVLNVAIAVALASISYRQDVLYFALLVSPILQAAFRFSFGAMLAVTIAGATLNFFWVWNYFRSHPPSQIGEYMEAGTISLIYAAAAILVWVLVTHLRSKEADLARARKQLSMEEKLAAVGRFSSAIAHEIRNPVAMISSALATAKNAGLSPQERQEMFDIAAKEASRLEKLTGDFLAYARPTPPSMHLGDVAESVAYIADICQPHASERAVTIHTHTEEGLCAQIDSGQIQRALLNLVINAIEASPSGGAVALRAKRDDGLIRVEIENTNGPIPRDAVERVFEPFFTTKPAGTGLGLAIARNIARGHGGELVLTRNETRSVLFSITIPARNGTSERQ